MTNVITESGKLVEFSYSKYGQHIVAIKCGNFNRELFDTCKLFMENDTRAEYERVKGTAAKFAKEFVETYNSNLHPTATTEALAALEWIDGFIESNNGLIDTDIDALNHIRAALQRNDVPQWQPIDTAPNDGTFMVVCDDPRDDRGAMIVGGQMLQRMRSPNQPEHLSLRHMTHWMPLPAAPKPTGV